MSNKVFFLFFFPIWCFSQDVIKGKIKTETPEVSGILVVNLTHQNETRTDGFGRFSIKAEEGDLLIISAPHIHKKRHLVEKEDFQKELEIKIEALPIEIEVVEIVRSDITSESLGLVPEGQKRYTPAERRLITTQNEQHLGALLNLISGRTKMLKALVEMEREDHRVTYLSDRFPDDYFVETLNIHPDNVMEFKYFALYEILKDIKNKQKGLYFDQLSKNDLELLLIPLSEMYLARKNQTRPEE